MPYLLKYRSILCTVLLFLISGCLSAWANECVNCHEDTWEELKDSIHGQQAISCDRCHGGDPNQADPVKAKAPETGYIGIPDKKQIVEKCGSCHADVETMNFYGIRTDQLARYKTSMHGKKLLGEGDEDVAACVDCHGYHGVVKISEPSSPVHPFNVPQTCNACHGNSELMAKHNLPSDTHSLYKNSVHGKALLEKQDASVAQCASCHGGHGAVPPGVRFVEDTCGKCHVNEKKYFLESPHAKLSNSGQFFGCVSCHGNHAVQHPDKNMYQSACIKCHAQDSVPYKKGLEIERLLGAASQAYDSAQEAIKQASIEGFFVENEEALLEETHAAVVEMHPTQHTLDYEKLVQLQKKAWQSSYKIKENLEIKRSGQKRRRVILVFIWIFILIMASALWVRYHQLEKERKK